MRPAVNQKLGLAALMSLILLCPVRAEPGYPTRQDGWIQQLTGFVLAQEGMALMNGEHATYDVYLDQLNVVRGRYKEGDDRETYVAMNRFMDMLESRDGGISAKAADAIWDYCYQVTPPALHDVKRHKQWWDKTVDWQKFFWEE